MASRPRSARPTAGRTDGPAARRRANAAAARETERRAGQRRRAIWISGTAVLAVIVVIAALVLVRAAGGGKSTARAVPSGPAPAAVVSAVANVPLTTLAAVGTGTSTGLPTPIAGAPALVAGGKPRVLYVGAEYCPFCAAQRWAVAVALSKFGTFTNLRVARSAPGDVHPNTATLSFHGAAFTSNLLSFTGVETTTNVRQGNSYQPLDTLTAGDQAIVATYDAPPYVPSGSTGGIPFVDIGGRYLTSGATYDPSVLSGKTQEQIAASLANPTSPVARAVDGAANGVIATLCTLTGGRPANVCHVPAIVAIQAKVKTGG